MSAETIYKCDLCKKRKTAAILCHFVTPEYAALYDICIPCATKFLPDISRDIIAAKAKK